MSYNRRKFLQIAGWGMGAATLAKFGPSVARDETPTAVPIMERVAGPTASIAVVGNGKMSVGISRYGELVMLKWPSLSFNDHLLHRTLFPVPLIWTIESYDRRLGAYEDHGHFAGLILDGGKSSKTSWFRDAEWRTSISWVEDSVPWLRTVHKHTKNNIEVTVDDIVLHQEDILLRTYRIKMLKAKSSPRPSMMRSVTALAPCVNRNLREPNADWSRDEENGWVTLSLNDSIVACDRLKAPVAPEDLADLAELDRLTRAGLPLDTPLSSVGVAVVWDSAPQKSQLFPAARHSRNPDQLPPRNQKIVRQGASVILQDHTLVWNARDEATVTLAIGAAAFPANAVERTKVAIRKSSANVKKTANYWRQRIKNVRLPNVGSQYQPVLKRTLINLLLAQEPKSGAVGGGFSHQPAYGFVWPRETGYYNYCLASAGFIEEAKKSAIFLASCQRTREGQDARNPRQGPIGSWAQCYASDRQPAWVYDLEIDEVGLGCWGLLVPAKFLKGEERRAYLERVFPAMGRSADLLTRWKDERTGLQPKAREDDLPWESQTIYGGATVLTGLDAAISAADLLGEKSPRVTRWRVRRQELERAIWQHYWRDKNGFGAGLGSSAAATILWPSSLIPSSDQRAQSYSDILYDWLRPFIERQKSAVNVLHEWWYVPRITCALTHVWQGRKDRAQNIEKLLTLVLSNMLIPGVYSYGESCLLSYSKEHNGFWYTPRVGTPQNFTAALAYLTALNTVEGSTP